MKLTLSLAVIAALFTAMPSPAMAITCSSVNLNMTAAEYAAYTPFEQEQIDDCRRAKNVNIGDTAGIAMGNGSDNHEAMIGGAVDSSGTLEGTLLNGLGSVGVASLDDVTGVSNALDDITGLDTSGFVSAVDTLNGTFNSAMANVAAIKATAAAIEANVKATFNNAKTAALNNLKAMALDKLGLGFDPTIIIKIYKKVMSITKDIKKIQQYIQMAAMLTGSKALAKVAEVGEFASTILSVDAGMKKFATKAGITVPAPDPSQFSVWQTNAQTTLITGFKTNVTDKITALSSNATATVSSYVAPLQPTG